MRFLPCRSLCADVQSEQKLQLLLNHQNQQQLEEERKLVEERKLIEERKAQEAEKSRERVAVMLQKEVIQDVTKEELENIAAQEMM